MARKFARYVNKYLAEYLIPMSLDNGEVEAILIRQEDTLINPPGIKRLGGLGNVGMNAAVALADSVPPISGYGVFPSS
jgi:xanthine dehydrogenase YagR molybdenum-binding subunit